jgi:membrane associated rhomboid family serine protease
MLTFYFFGQPLEKALGRKKLVKFYLGAGLAASIGVVLFQSLLGFLHGPEAIKPIVGASGAVVATVGVISKLYPNAEVLLYFFIPMKIKTAVYAFGGLETINLIAAILGVQLPIIGAFASSAHLTGLLVGLWYGEKIKDDYQRETAVFDPLRY